MGESRPAGTASYRPSLLAQTEGIWVPKAEPTLAPAVGLGFDQAEGLVG